MRHPPDTLETVTNADDAKGAMRRYLFVLVVLMILTLAVLPVVGEMFFNSGHQHEVLPPGGVLYNWESLLLAIHVIADVVIGVSSLAICGTLAYLVSKVGSKMPYRWIIVIFGMFLIGSSLIHFMNAVTIWKSLHWVSAEIKYLTALLAVATAVMFPLIIPSILQFMRTAVLTDERKKQLEARNSDLVKLNEDLQLQILERGRAEKRNEESLLRLRTVIDNLPMGASIVDQHGIVTHMNAESCRLLELERKPEQIIGTDGREALKTYEQKIVHTDSIASQEIHEVTGEKLLGAEIVFQDGKILTRDFIPILAADKRLGAFSLYYDVTHQRRADMLKSEFMSLASHQLRTPLTILKWSYGRLAKGLRGKLDSQQAQLLEEAHSATDRMSKTIDTMLAIARIEAGRIRVEVSEAKLGQLLFELQSDMRDAYERKHQSLHIHCLPNIFIRTDIDILKEILGNLLSNAIKYTPDDGGINVYVEERETTVSIRVKDNGYGIPKEQQGKIFQKFFRADNIVQNDTQGTGLGLYLVHLLTKLLRGSIHFTSVEGKGTTFTLVLPRDFDRAGE